MYYLGFVFLVLHWIQIFFLKDEIYTKLKLGRRVGIQSRKERMQEESNKEKREEKREPILCYMLLHAISAERDGTIDWNVYRQECTSQGKHCRLVCLFLPVRHAKTDLVKCYTSIS
jgi:hypothetical protein